MDKLDYLVIGHVTHDLLPDGSTALGGTATYSGLAAQALGCRTGIITSVAADLEIEPAFPGIRVHRVPAAQTTTFENVYTEHGRLQIVHSFAETLHAENVPDGWERAGIVHLGPLVHEVDPEIAGHFSNSLIGVTPQGWMRQWDASGRVSASAWPLAESLFPQAAAVIISEEDLPDSATLQQFRTWAHLLVLTRGPAGATLFVNDEVRDFPAPRVNARVLTGAGDIFATAFLIRLHQTKGNPWEAARFANEAAARSVTQSALRDKIGSIEGLHLSGQ